MSLLQGETVVDLGSGAGFDVFQAAKKVGPTGRAIGVDMNKVCLAATTVYPFPITKGHNVDKF